jgi:NADH-quinone oxidoreductase subunit E
MEDAAKAEEQEIREAMPGILDRFAKTRDRVIPLLQEVQEKFGYLPQEAIRQVSFHLGMTDVEIYGVASFYNYFRFTPLGKNPIQMCMGTACHMTGGGLVLESLARSLDIEVGGLTEDRAFSLDRVACIGCCSLAPVMVVGDRIFPKMTSTKVDEALVNLKMEEEETAQAEGEDPES